jgi:DNA-binding PadR family transcriptional regulator
MKHIARLLALGIVRMHGQTYGYRAYREMQSWNVETWAHMKPGSIYHALGQLAKQGALRQVQIEPSTTGPARTVFEMTDEGEREFQSLLSEALSSPDIEYLSAGLIFIEALPRAQAIELLQQRLDKLATIRAELNSALANPNAPWSTATYAWQPTRHPELAHIWVGLYDHAIAATNSLIERLRNGAYHMADDPSHP